jgi:hypothetical protein
LIGYAKEVQVVLGMNATTGHVRSNDRFRDPNQSWTPMGIRVSDVTEYVAGIAASLRLDARELDHRGPFLGFVGNEFPEIGGRAYKRCAS